MENGFQKKEPTLDQWGCDNRHPSVVSFRGSFFFVSNFYPAKVTYEGITYENNEAAFQAQKVLSREEKLKFQYLSPNDAKKLGRKVKLRDDWEYVKDGLMYNIVRAKFAQNPSLRDQLLRSGATNLVEGNEWGDTYWGVCRGKGQNKLGKILMHVRSELRQEVNHGK